MAHHASQTMADEDLDNGRCPHYGHIPVNSFQRSCRIHEFPMNRLTLAMIVCALGLSMTGCHSRYGTPGSFVVSGTVTGLTTNGLVLTDNRELRLRRLLELH